MKAKIRALIILSILTVLLASAYVLIPDGRQSVSGGTQDKPGDAVVINDFPLGDLLALAITNSRGSFGILNKADSLTMVSDREGSFSIPEMRAITYLACHLEGIRRLDTVVGEADIKDPLAHFSLILEGGREYNYLILRKSPVSDDYLLFSEEDQCIFVISRSSAEWFLRSAEDFLE